MAPKVEVTRDNAIEVLKVRLRHVTLSLTYLRAARKRSLVTLALRTS